MATEASLGIIAGSGQFPLQVARGARAGGRKVYIIGLSGHTDPALAAEADDFRMIHLGQFAKLVDFFHGHGVRELCLAGAVSKPRLFELRPDFKAVKFMLRLRGKGDDALLRAAAEALAEEGLCVVKAAAFVPDLAAPAGLLSKRRPDEQDMESIRYGWPIARAMGGLDIGQLIVVKSSMVVAVEAIEGTDATLERGGRLGGEGCVAIKIFKPGQDERVDQPAIGPGTFRVMAAHGYRALAYEAGKTLFFDREEALRIADAAGLAVIGLPAEGP